MKTFIVSLLIACLLFYPGLGKAQFNNDISNGEPTGFGSDHGPGNGDEDVVEDGRTTENAPIDGGLSVLLIAGAAYGAKKIAVNRAKTKAAK